MPRKILSSVEDWLTYFENLHPVGIDMGLSRVSAVWEALRARNGIEKIATELVITVSGTNGKGSTCQMLSLFLCAEDTKVGVYTSPHIHHFNERVQIDGHVVGDELIIRAFEEIEDARGDTSLSYFEATTLVGLLIFAWERVDYAILEVGLGGRLDAINVVDADAVIVTSVGVDHEAFLGNDVASIAVEKAGVMRAGKPAVFAQPRVYQSVLDYAREHEVPLLSQGIDYQRDGTEIDFHGLCFHLPDSLLQWGEHQLQNAAAVVVLLSTLQLLPKDYRKRLENFSLSGRLQVIAENPRVIVDVAHNEDAALALASYIRQHKDGGKTFAIIGMLCDKDHEKVLSLFDGIFDEVYFASTQGERGYTGHALQRIWERCCSAPSKVFDEFDDCLRDIRRISQNTDVVYAFGSFLVAEALTKDDIS